MVKCLPFETESDNLSNLFEKFRVVSIKNNDVYFKSLLLLSQIVTIKELFQSMKLNSYYYFILEIGL